MAPDAPGADAGTRLPYPAKVRLIKLNPRFEELAVADLMLTRLVEQKHETGIEVWAQVTENRVYRIPYSKPMEEALERAREQARGGLPVVMNKRAGGSKSGKSGALADAGEMPYDSNIVLPSELTPKKPVGPA